MLRKIVDIALLYLETTFRSRGTLFSAIIMPLIFTIVLGQAIGNPGGGGPAAWSVQVVNEDNDSLSNDLVQRLESDPLLDVQAAPRDEALAILAEEETVAVVIIPEGFSIAIEEGANTTIEFHTNGLANEVQIVDAAVQAAIAEIRGAVAAAHTAVQAANLDFDQTLVLAQNKWQSPPIMVSTEAVTRFEDRSNNIAVGVAQSAPGMMIMFSMFFMLGGASTLVQEREDGTLRRLLVMPIKKIVILLGKLEGVYISGLIQVTILILVGALLFGVNWGEAPLALALMVLCYAFAITSLGMLMAALVRTQAQVDSITTIVVLAMAPLGGAWWPLEIVPDWMRTLGHFFPTAWAMDGFSDIVTRGLGLQDILLEAAALLGFGIVFLAIGIWRFRYE